MALKKLKIDVLLADGAYYRLKQARMDSIEIYYGEVLSEHAEHTLEVQHLSHLLCATDNDFYNALACKALGREFGHHRSFQLALHQESNQELRRLSLQQRGYIAFAAGADFETLHQRLIDGWKIQTSRLSESYDLEQMKKRLGEPLKEWLLLGAVTPEGAFRMYSGEQTFKPEAGWTVLYFAPPTKREGKAKGDAQ